MSRVTVYPQTPKDPNLEIAAGNIPGLDHDNKYGFNPGLTTGGTAEDIWDAGGTWTVPVVAQTYTIVSGSANDVGDLKWFGLDSNYALTSGTGDVDGTNGFTTPSLWMIYRMRYKGHGAGIPKTENEGIITATGDTSSNVVAQINVGNSNTLMAIFQIPAGTNGQLTSWYGGITDTGGASALVDLRLWMLPDGETWQIDHVGGAAKDGSTDILHKYAPYKNVDAKTIIKMVGTGSANSLAAFAGFDVILDTR